MYAGLRAMDAHKVKSFEGVDIAWVEEAQTVSEKSWLTLENTIRADGSEIWVSFNPDLDSDPTYKRFVVSRQPESVVKKVTWRDNPFYSKVLEPGRDKLRETDPIAYDNVWEGNPRSVVEGAIYAREVTAMIEQNARNARAVRPEAAGAHDLGLGLERPDQHRLRAEGDVGSEGHRLRRRVVPSLR
jgi:phage terminase large subunit